MKKILRIDMSNCKCELTDMPPQYQRLGGRGLTSTLIAREVKPTCHPLGTNNKLVIAPGILAGTVSPCSQRMSVGAKSPLTGGIKEANAGGTAAQKMGRLGAAAIVLEGRPPGDGLYLVHLAKDGARLEPADYLKGLGNYGVVQSLREHYGSHIGIISIGQAGEMRMCSATVAITDKDGNPARHAARGGLGAVMGSKGIKAIVVDDAGAPRLVKAVNQKALQETAKSFTAVIRERPRIKHRLGKYGTAGLLSFANEVNSLPTRNFSTGQFEAVERIGGDTVVERIDARGGERGHSCYAGCVICCSNVYRDKEGQYLTSSFEYETIGMLGSNCGIDDIDTIATLDRLCDDYGVDTIEVGGAMGVAMEAGVLSFGDGRRAIELLHEIGRGTPMGRILGNGVAVTGKVFGMTRVPAIKGQGLPAWDPRTAQATGVTFVTSPQGADHTAGRLTGITEFDYLVPGTIASLSKDLQIMACAYDTVGLCHFADGTPETAVWLGKLLSAFYGEDFTTEQVKELGEDVLRTELSFNLAAGITEAEDRLPEFMMEEALPPTNSLFTVPQEEIEEVFAPLRKGRIRKNQK
ncbi:MAG: aldehyde ferredoxin oxidoreductase C-terminal domain-containing protein [Desulfobaccales bacterium]